MSEEVRHVYGEPRNQWRWRVAVYLRAFRAARRGNRAFDQLSNCEPVDRRNTRQPRGKKLALDGARGQRECRQLALAARRNRLSEMDTKVSVTMWSERESKSIRSFPLSIA